MKTLVAVFLLLAITVPVLPFDGYDGDHAGQIPLCRNNKTGVIKFAPMKDIDPTITGKNFEPYCNTNPPYGSTIPTEEMIWINSQGIQGIQGEKGDQGPQGVPGVGLNPPQVALLRWYDVNQTGITFAVGGSPQELAFDGANIWVTNYMDNNVTKLRASDGANLGSFAVGSFPQRIALDGANIWVANLDSDNVTKLRASDGANLGTFSVGSGARGIAFDGANIWVTNGGSNSVSKL